MFQFLKRAAKAARTPEPTPAPHRTASPRNGASGRSRPGLLEPPPVGDVQEIDDESAWDLWEHSQMELDSRMGPLTAFDSIKVKDATPSQFCDPDPFSKVRTKE
jgi:hypothetical protein